MLESENCCLNLLKSSEYLLMIIVRFIRNAGIRQ